MKKEVYICDCCEKQIESGEPKIVSMSADGKRYKKEMCDKCLKDKVMKFNRQRIFKKIFKKKEKEDVRSPS